MYDLDNKIKYIEMLNNGDKIVRNLLYSNLDRYNHHAIKMDAINIYLNILFIFI